MKIYIRATANISPQDTFGFNSPLREIKEYNTNRLACIEPDYREYIDVKLIRRMSRIVKMGVAAALQCLKEAAVTQPDAIITGTAYGCMEDTGSFITRMIEQKEEMLSPTAFIQSTHNTVGAQIALLLNCNNYNNTFVHRGFSFESALLDAIMLLHENEAGNVLVGSVDEITNLSHGVLTRFGIYKTSPVSNMGLFACPSKGTIAGEGAGFFLLANEVNANNYAELVALTTFFKPGNISDTEEQITIFLKSQSVNMNDIDLVITGKNGDEKNDHVYDKLASTIFDGCMVINYKHLCGEYPTSTSFALWLAAKVIKTQTLPAAIDNSGVRSGRFRKVLIYNNYQNVHHSLLLVSAC